MTIYTPLPSFGFIKGTQYRNTFLCTDYFIARCHPFIYTDPIYEGRDFINAIKFFICPTLSRLYRSGLLTNKVGEIVL